MSTYDEVLPAAFPYCLESSEEKVEQAISYLLPARGYIANGSSFAVTSDAGESRRKLWLSEISYMTLKNLGVL